jgi:DNA-binding MarR family transcriptional regulator
MITRVGVVGPKDSVQMICHVGKEFQDQLILVPFVYQDAEEARDIVRFAEGTIDVWLFSGQVPYAIAKEHIHKQKAYFPQLNGSSLTKVLLEMVYRDGLRLERVSFDTILDVHFHETCSELGLACEQVYLLSYTGYKPMAELIDFHTSLYAQGKVDACATCLRSVYEELKGKDIPVYRVTPNRMSIRTMLELARQEGETLHFKKSQIAVQVVEVEGLDRLIGENKSSYDVRRMELKLQELILNYAEALSGAMVPVGNGKNLIFSTRGSFEENRTLPPSVLMENILLLADLPTHIGIGFGVTALAAERNAQLALLHAKKMGECNAVLVDDEGNIEGPLQKPDSLSFHFRTEDKAFSDRLKQAGVTVTTYNKLLSVQKKLGQQSISAGDIAEWLGMTQRNARRILHELEVHGLAEMIGEEAPASRGRPRKIYRITPPSTQ